MSGSATNTMSYRGYNARITYDDQDQIFFGHLAGIKDIVGFHAETVPDLRQAFKEAVDEYLDLCDKTGTTPQKAYSGKVMFRLDPDLHRRASIAAELEGKSLNQWAEAAIEQAVSLRRAVRPKSGGGSQIASKGSGKYDARSNAKLVRGAKSGRLATSKSARSGSGKQKA